MGSKNLTQVVTLGSRYLYPLALKFLKKIFSSCLDKVSLFHYYIHISPSWKKSLLWFGYYLHDYNHHHKKKCCLKTWNMNIFCTGVSAPAQAQLGHPASSYCAMLMALAPAGVYGSSKLASALSIVRTVNHGPFSWWWSGRQRQRRSV